MKQLMIFAAVIATGALLTTGCSTCCKKDGSCAKPMARTACTNSLDAGLVIGIMGCTNHVSCTNSFSVELLADGVACTNHLSSVKG